MASRVAEARGEEPVGTNWDKRGNGGYGQGGPWSALMLYAKKLTVSKNPHVPRTVGPSVVPTKVDALLAKWPTKQPAPTITTGADGTITIPAAAFTSKNRSAALSTSWSAGPGTQVLHGGCPSSVGAPCLVYVPTHTDNTTKIDDMSLVATFQS